MLSSSRRYPAGGLVLSFNYPTYQEWLESLPEPERERALKLADQFRANGCATPEDWVRSEVSEDFCQFATYLFLSNLWRCEIDLPWSETPETWVREFSRTVGQSSLPVFDDAAAALQRLQAAEGSAEDLG